tara:strand:+ start:143 stop:655 length:513 start_codon:yes stop_codon:yes gene_type:complete
MKKLLFLLISIPLIFSSCEKEEENPSNNNNNSNTGTSGSFYETWNVTSFVNIYTPTNGTPDEYNHTFLPNEYIHVTFLNQPHPDVPNHNWFIVENGYYDNSMVWTIDIDSNGTYTKNNNDLIIEDDCGYPVGVEDMNYVITLLTNNKLEFFTQTTTGEGTYHNTWKLERP